MSPAEALRSWTAEGSKRTWPRSREMAVSEAIQGEGNLMTLRFKALSTRAASAFAAQVSAMGPTGASLSNAASQPLNLLIKP